MSKDEKLLTTTEVAERLNVSIASVQRWIRQGNFPGAYKAGPGSRSHYRIPEPDFEAFVEKQKAAISATSKE